MPGQNCPHDLASQRPGLSRNLHPVLHGERFASEPRLPAIDEVELVLGLARQVGALDDPRKLVLAVGQVRVQYPHHRAPHHLEPIRGAHHGGQVRLHRGPVHLLDPASLEKEPPLLTAHQHRARTPGPEKTLVSLPAFMP